MPTTVDPARVEQLGPAECIIQTLISFSDHIYHGRTGIVQPDPSSSIGARFTPAVWKLDAAGAKQVFALRRDPKAKRNRRDLVGVLQDDGRVTDPAGTTVASFRQAGLYPEAVVYLYSQVAEVWRLDNELCARWASWAFTKDHRDLKVVLSAFLLVQSRCGAPYKDGDDTYNDADYRDVGEAMSLIRDQQALGLKELLRIGGVLQLPAVAALNRTLGFGASARRAPMGRYDKLCERWLRYRELNPAMLDGLVRAGQRRAVIRLCKLCKYKPQSPAFFQTLRWKQGQAPDGRRRLAIGMEVAKAATFAGLTEAQICERIVAERMNLKRVAGMLPAEVGLTRAIVLASIEAGGVSDAELVMRVPTLEELGMLTLPDVAQRLERALAAANNRRAANIARNVHSAELKQKLEASADAAGARAVEEATRGLRLYVCIDKSGSMQECIEKAKELCAKLLVAIPMDRLHVSIFNDIGQVLSFPRPTAAAVAQVLSGHRAGGGTCYARGVMCLQPHAPTDPNEDTIILFVGDQLDDQVQMLAKAVQQSELRPMAFGMLQVQPDMTQMPPQLRVAVQRGDYRIVEQAAALLQIPCFHFNLDAFEDPYAIDRTIRALVQATPVSMQPRAAASAPKRKSLVEQILQTELLKKPAWAVAA